MARPMKNRVDYFPHVTRTGKTIAILEARWGNDGYAFWFKTLELLGGSEGFFYDCNKPSDWEYLLSKTRVTEDVANAILKKLAEIDAIDAALWSEGIIWSDNFAGNLGPVFDKRKTTPPTKPEFPGRKPSPSEVSAPITDENVAAGEFPVPEIDKVKDSKVKDKRKKTTTSLPSGEPSPETESETGVEAVAEIGAENETEAEIETEARSEAKPESAAEGVAAAGADASKTISLDPTDSAENPAAPDFAAVARLVSRYICPVTSRIEADTLREWSETLPQRWIVEAVRQAALSKARSVKYVDKILQSWRSRYRPEESPWLAEGRRNRASPAKQSFAMRRLAQLAQEAAGDEAF